MASSSNSNNHTFNIHDDYIGRVEVNYTEDDATLMFKNEELFQEWLKMVNKKHANFPIHTTDILKPPSVTEGLLKPARKISVLYQCDHAGKPKKKKETAANNNIKKRQKTKDKRLYQNWLYCNNS